MNPRNLRSILLASMIAINSIIADQVEDYNSGKSRITHIMSNDDTGIAAYNKQHIQYAETQNLTQDLNIAEIAKFFDCKTLIGQSFLTETLKFPVSPQDKDTVLAHRQAIIKALVENPELKHKIDQLLEIAQQEEQEVVKLMSEFFIGQTCPELSNLELIKKQNPVLYPLFKFFCQNPTGKMVNTTLNLISLATFSCATYYCGNFTYAIAQSGADYTQVALYTGYLGLMTGVSAYTAYKDYSTAFDKRFKLHALNQLIQIAEKIETLVSDYALESQFKISAIKDSQGTRLIEKLQHARYDNKQTFLFLTPLVHAFLYELYESDTHLAQVFACVAEMDAYNAIATKIVTSQQESNKFCFVTFTDSATPSINAQSFWNVLVKDAVTSSITEDKHIILTGPNAGGKTTTIRAILQNIVLGQSFGVAAAESCEMTMFDVVYSYLNISDDLINGLSLFASEVKRAQDVLQRIKALEPNKKFFFALDELFTGTVAQDGEECAYNFIKRIADFDGVLFVYATHFDKLKELGNEGENCINYKVDAPTKNAEGKLVYPFTLSKGANESRVALDLANQAHLFE